MAGVCEEKRMNAQIGRREALSRGGRLALGAIGGLAALCVPVAAQEKDKAPEKPRKRILFYTRSQTFEHSTVKRKDGELGHAEKILVELGAKHGFDVEATKDGRRFSPENIARFDAFFFYTTGDATEKGGDNEPPMAPEGKKALLDAIAAGKGFLGSHCGSDSFHSKGDAFATQSEEERDPYIRMLGGEFIRHGPQQVAGMKVVSPKFPGAEGLGEGFRMNEEWYSLRNFSPDIHVILVQETKGMNGSDYERPNFPATWARKHGKGRVFYTSMGHREDVWTDPRFQTLLLGGIGWVFGHVEADLTPNLKTVTPEAHVMPPKPEPAKKA